jgi:hypothetical protein
LGRSSFEISRPDDAECRQRSRRELTEWHDWARFGLAEQAFDEVEYDVNLVDLAELTTLLLTSCASSVPAAPNQVRGVHAGCDLLAGATNASPAVPNATNASPAAPSAPTDNEPPVPPRTGAAGSPVGSSFNLPFWFGAP